MAADTVVVAAADMVVVVVVVVVVAAAEALAGNSSGSLITIAKCLGCWPRFCLVVVADLLHLTDRGANSPIL